LTPAEASDRKPTHERVRTIVNMRLLALFTLLAGLAGCLRPSDPPAPAADPSVEATTPVAAAAIATTDQPAKDTPAPAMAIATFANGCFWCTEAVFEQLRGVRKVVSGYIGGSVDDPTYKEVCNGTTGHAEALQIEYDPTQVDYATLLEVFWKTHDPTTLNRQGNDVGTQYRSGIFFHDAEQERLAREYKAKLDASGAFDDPIVTEITPASKFWPAEDYHQGYYRANPSQGYCRVVIAPKVEKFRKVFADKLKP
jgi:peptide-methionine (S)-S-oxide reductase